MATHLENLDVLKRMLMEGKEFSEIISFFFDNLGYSQDFLRKGKPANHKILKESLKKVGEHVFGKPCAFSNILIINSAIAPFYHGSVTMNGNHTIFIFFEDIKIGLLAATMSEKFGQMSYVRFSATTLTGDKAANLVVPGKKTIH